MSEIAAGPVKPKRSRAAVWILLGMVGLYQFLEGGFSRVLVLTEIAIIVVCGGLIWLAKKIAEGYRK